MTDPVRLAILAALFAVGGVLYGAARRRLARRGFGWGNFAAGVVGIWGLVTGGMGLFLMALVAVASRLL